MQILKNRAVQIVLGLVVIIALGFAAFTWLGPKKEEPVAAPAPAPTVNSPTFSPAPDSPPAAPTTPTGPTCTNTTEEINEPKKFVVQRMGVDSKMITVAEDEDGNPGAPPKDAAYTTAWYNGSPHVGSDKGNVILTIHTYSKGQALGNDLYGKDGLSEGKGGLKEGDVIKITGENNKQVCYRYTSNTKVWEKTYDPKSGVFFNLEGPPQLAIMICWDYDASRKNWDSRIIFYAQKMAQGQV